MRVARLIVAAVIYRRERALDNDVGVFPRRGGGGDDARPYSAQSRITLFHTLSRSSAFVPARSLDSITRADRLMKCSQWIDLGPESVPILPKSRLLLAISPRHCFL